MKGSDGNNDLLNFAVIESSAHNRNNIFKKGCVC